MAALTLTAFPSMRASFPTRAVTLSSWSATAMAPPNAHGFVWPLCLSKIFSLILSPSLSTNLPRSTDPESRPWVTDESPLTRLYLLPAASVFFFRTSLDNASSPT